MTISTKKVIAFSLWGQDRKYCIGALENAKKAKELMPDWTARFYCAGDVPCRVVRDLEKYGAEIVIKKFSTGFMGCFWRLEVADDPGVERFLQFDTDSRITPRYVWCVQDWEKSGEPAHIIRDNESHAVWMLAGTWGMVNSFLPSRDLNMRDLILEFWSDAYEGHIEKGFGGGNDKDRFYGADQEFLSRKIWPLISGCHLAHVADYPKLKFTGKEKSTPPLERLADMANAPECYIGQICSIGKEWEHYEY
jgi:hypothetical protein